MLLTCRYHHVLQTMFNGPRQCIVTLDLNGVACTLALDGHMLNLKGPLLNDSIKGIYLYTVATDANWLIDYVLTRYMYCSNCKLMSVSQARINNACPSLSTLARKIQSSKLTKTSQIQVSSCIHRQCFTCLQTDTDTVIYVTEYCPGWSQ